MSKAIPVQITDGIKSGTYRVKHMTWEAIVGAAEHPLSLSPGQESPLWSFYVMLPQPEMDRRLGLPRGISANVKSVRCMQLDYDNGTTTIDDWLLEWGDYRHVLYTTKSHTPAHNKFRVIMPLGECIERDLYTNGKTLLRSMFPGCDPTTFDKWRKQRIPHCIGKTPVSYYSHACNGDKRLFLDKESLLAAAPKQPEQSSPLVKLPSNSNVFTSSIDALDAAMQLDDLQRRYEKELDSIDFACRGAGQDVHYVLRRMTYSMKSFGMDPRDVLQWFIERVPNNATLIKEISDLCRG